MFKPINNFQSQASLPCKFNLHTIISTWFYIGFFPLAPGTFASLATYPLFLSGVYLFSSSIASQLFFLCLSVLAFVLGWFSIQKLQQEVAVHDHASIVIDEVMGQLLTFGISYQLLSSLTPLLSSYTPCQTQTIIFFIGVIAFRFFDITKPLLVGTIDQQVKGTLGVLLDDGAAALFASFSISFFYGIYIIFQMLTE